MILKAGTRPSGLAIKQVEEIARYFLNVKLEIIPIWTTGDKDKRTSLSDMHSRDFFTKEIETALLNDEVDVAVHSAKDIEGESPEGLIIAAITESISPYECVVSKDHMGLEGLPHAAVIGTSSKKRQDAIRLYRRDFIVKDIRGDIEERLNKLDRGEFDAIIVAHAALIRLGLENRIAEIISPYVVEPHPLQGRLVVQVKKGRIDLIQLFRGIHAE